MVVPEFERELSIAKSRWRRMGFSPTLISRAERRARNIIRSVPFIWRDEPEVWQRGMIPSTIEGSERWMERITEVI